MHVIKKAMEQGALPTEEELKRVEDNQDGRELLKQGLEPLIDASQEVKAERRRRWRGVVAAEGKYEEEGAVVVVVAAAVAVVVV
jgi:hypothetical protein